MYDINKEIIHLGYIPENDLVSILAASTVFCFPSFIEGFGLPPLEAMKSGIAVVTTSGTSLPEVCEDAVIYFEPSDYLGLARSIESVINNSELRQSLVKKGLVQASKFSWDNSANKLLNILESVYNDGEDNTIY
jgi:glycosyltransferase involved in cell wall biosynthesis